MEKHGVGTTPRLLLDLLEYIEKHGVPCKLKDSVSALKCILEEHLTSGADLKTVYADEIGRRKYQNRSGIYRCVGSTLLVKGLEFDHAVIVRDFKLAKKLGRAQGPIRCTYAGLQNDNLDIGYKLANRQRSRVVRCASVSQPQASVTNCQSIAATQAP